MEDTCDQVADICARPRTVGATKQRLLRKHVNE